MSERRWKRERHARPWASAKQVSQDVDASDRIWSGQCVCALSCVLLCAMLVLGLPGCRRTSEPSDVVAQEYDLARAVHLSDEVVELGQVIVPSMIERDIIVENRGPKTIKLISSYSSCGCLVVTKNEVDVEPNCQAVVAVRARFDKPSKYHQAVVLGFEAAGQQVFKVIRVRADAVMSAQRHPV